MKYSAMAAAACLLVIGCNAPNEITTQNGASQTMSPTGGSAANQTDQLFQSLPGVPKLATQVTDGDKIFRSEGRLVVAKYGTARQDPFALKPSEKKFEVDQESARVMNSMGGWTVMFTPPEEKNPNAGLINEPQPYRRLSGIIVGDSVYALLDNGDGQPIIIRPGMKIPGSDWTVASIDSEKAVLRRSGNKLPRQVVVRLESPPAGIGGGNSGNGNAPGQMGPGKGGRPGMGTGGPGNGNGNSGAG